MGKEQVAMKRITKAISLLIVFALAWVIVPKANAEIVVLDPEKTTTFYLEYMDACAVEGQITFSNPAIISSISYDMSESNMEGAVENGVIFLYSPEPAGVSGKVGITVTVHSGAAKGASCDVVFQYAVTEPGSTLPGATQVVTNTVTVSTAGAEPTTPPTTPTQPGSKVDTSMLQFQISVAEKLTSYDYTKETWANVASALNNAYSKLTSKSQKEVDNATAQLKQALAKLRSMDYSALSEALTEASKMPQHPEFEAAWIRFMQALENARVQRTSGDQEAVNAATEELLASKAALDEALGVLATPDEVEKPVLVPTEPDYPYCNNFLHIVFLILMIASMVLNLALFAIIVMYLVKKQLNKRDTTPLVEYNIDDDDAEN